MRAANESRRVQLEFDGQSFKRLRGVAGESISGGQLRLAIVSVLT